MRGGSGLQERPVVAVTTLPPCTQSGPDSLSLTVLVRSMQLKVLKFYLFYRFKAEDLKNVMMNVNDTFCFVL